MPQVEQPVAIQSDTLTTSPVPVRMVTVNAIIGGVATPVQMQVVSVADSNGVLLDLAADDSTARHTVMILKDIRIMLSKLCEMPFADNQPNFYAPGTSQG